MNKINITYSSLTDIGNVRKANEDNLGHSITQNGAIFTVCDGMGGHVGGATASKIAVDCIINHLHANTDSLNGIEINNAIVLANQSIIEAAKENPELRGMGTTCTVLVVNNETINIGHVGDSRIYILHKQKLHRITKDHSFVQNLVDSGAIQDHEAENHPRKNELTRALGVRNLVEPTINTDAIKPIKGDKFLLCTDGLCGLINDKEIEQILNNTSNLNDCTAQLINAAKLAGGHDNITVQLIEITDSPYQQSSYPNFSPRENLSTTLIQPQYEKPSPKPSFLGGLSKVNLVLLSTLSTLLICIIGYLTYDHFKSSSSNSITNPVSETNKPGKKTKNKEVQENENNKSEHSPLECDEIIDGKLVHTVGAKVYSEFIDEHKEKNPSYDFSKAFDFNTNKEINVNKINKDKKIYWKKKEVIGQNTNNNSQTNTSTNTQNSTNNNSSQKKTSTNTQNSTNNNSSQTNTSTNNQNPQKTIVDTSKK